MPTTRSKTKGPGNSIWPGRAATLSGFLPAITIEYARFFGVSNLTAAFAIQPAKTLDADPMQASQHRDHTLIPPAAVATAPLSGCPAAAATMMRKSTC